MEKEKRGGWLLDFPFSSAFCVILIAIGCCIMVLVLSVFSIDFHLSPFVPMGFFCLYNNTPGHVH